MNVKKEVTIIGSDAGGTMTDIFLVDKNGEFVVGRASTTPRDESIGFRESLRDAAQYWGLSWDREARDILPGVLAAIYSGTDMLNALLTCGGRNGAGRD